MSGRKTVKRIAVIGGGASGLMAAISAAERGADVTIYESGTRLGRKILATGNGRCNFTNIYADITNYHGTDTNFILGAKKRFWVNETIDFFSNLGVLAKVEDEGRVYPYSGQASAVLDVLRFQAERLGVKQVCSFEVKSAEKHGSEFVITAFSGMKARADRLIVATGGKAAPNLGSKGGGYDILKSFGHKITALKPSLVQIKTVQNVRPLKGIRLYAAATLGSETERGEVLFTEYGLSGIAIFSLTAFYTNQETITLDIMPEYGEDEVCNFIHERVLNNPDITLENFLIGLFHKRVGQELLKRAGISPLSRTAKTLGRGEIDRLCGLIKNWEFNIEGTMSWNNAQTTKGGALTSGFDSATMQSKLVPGLYAAGEVLDIDGGCGGYNLQWAWSSGYLAGADAAQNNK